jgi:hypothetical protein
LKVVLDFIGQRPTKKTFKDIQRVYEDIDYENAREARLGAALNPRFSLERYS